MTSQIRDHRLLRQALISAHRARPNRVSWVSSSEKRSPHWYRYWAEDVLSMARNDLGGGLELSTDELDVSLCGAHGVAELCACLLREIVKGGLAQRRPQTVLEIGKVGGEISAAGMAHEVDTDGRRLIDVPCPLEEPTHAGERDGELCHVARSMEKLDGSVEEFQGVSRVSVDHIQSGSIAADEALPIRHAILSRHKLLPALAFVALIVFFLPQSWTGALISLVQILVPFQDGATAGVQLVADDGHGGSSSVSAEAYQSLLNEKNALENRVASLALFVNELENEVSLLHATRLWGGADSHLGARGQLIPAKVVGEDVLPWRSSRWVNVGSLQGVRPGSAVTTNHLEIVGGDANAHQSGLSVLLGETLVGVVGQQVGTHTSRVTLLSDVSVERRVKIGHVTPEQLQVVDGYFWLKGRGGALMEVGNVDRRLVREGGVEIGDFVLSDPADPMLPAAMVIGKVKSIRDDRANPLLNILTIGSSVNQESLRRVFVYSPETPSPERASSSSE